MEKIKDYENAEGVKRPGALLLDSSLITATNKVEYDMKIVQCGDYVQVYKFRRKKLVDKDLELLEDSKKDKIEFDELNLFKEENLKTKDNLKTIEYKNITRSKFQMERLIKTNENVFKTFITLTFAENITDINVANKKFHIWRTYMKKVNKEFLYVAVPEFQKRGAVHYHLLINIDYTNFDCLSKEERKIWDRNDKKWQIGRDVKGWSYGHNMAIDLKDMNVATYLSKYMTKDIDNRLYGHRRYLNSQNLNKPHESYIDLSNIKHYEYFDKILKEKEVVYTNSYVDYFGDEVNFFEFKKST